MQNLVIYAIPAFLGLVALEALWLRRQRRRYDGRDAAASLAMGVGNVVIAVVCKLFWMAVYVAVYEVRLFEIDMGPWWAWAALLVGFDFCFYWYHRFSHRVRLAWAAHVNHHSSESFNLTTALRQSWTTPLYSYAFFVPLALLGFPPLAVIAASGINLLYQFWIHTEVVGRVGPLEWVLNTPSHHRVHHGSNPQYLDRNYGGMFIVWDRLFGTFEPEVEPVCFGLTHNIRTYHPLRIAFHEFAAIARDVRAARSFGEAWRRVLKGPEWQPDGVPVQPDQSVEATPQRDQTVEATA